MLLHTVYTQYYYLWERDPSYRLVFVFAGVFVLILFSDALLRIEGFSFELCENRILITVFLYVDCSTRLCEKRIFAFAAAIWRIHSGDGEARIPMGGALCGR